MKQKQKQNNERSFEMNGGYFIDGVPYMDCKITGDPVRNVGVEATSVVGSRAVTARMHKMFPEENKPTRVKTGRPSGWHFMNEFVDKDGNVFHKGVEQPKLKGTLPPTKVKPQKKRKKRIDAFTELAKVHQEKQKLKRAYKKQQNFLNGKVKL